MTTAVASPPTFQSLPRISWNGGNSGAGGFAAMSADDVPRMFMPQRKSLPRSNSSSSLSSTSSSSSTSSTGTVNQPESVTSGSSNADSVQAGKKKARGGFWQVSKAESTSGITSARANGSVQASSVNGVNGKAIGSMSSPNPNTQSNGVRPVNAPLPSEPTAILALLPMNGTFERKQINVPFFPEVLRIGRQTNAKTVPTPVNGYFDSKVLSRQHAEVWAERNGKVWIRDVKSSNGTFVNGQRLSQENRESEPHELRQHDTLELGIDIVSEDQKTIVHHKVSAKVEYVGLPGSSNNVLDLSFGDLDPSHGGSLLASPISAPMVLSRSRPGGPGIPGRSSTPSSIAGSHISSAAQQRQLNFWGTPLNVEQLVKSLSVSLFQVNPYFQFANFLQIEMRAAKQQAQELENAGNFLTAIVGPDDNAGKLQSPANENGQSPQVNGRVKAPARNDHLTRFAEPPAPPPQQPLPEKPDSSKPSPINTTTALTNLLKRSETAKPSTNTTTSPTNPPPNSQMLALIEALSQAKKELDSQGERVKQLEEMLKQERSARENAEERARKLEQTAMVESVKTTEETSDVPLITDVNLASTEKDLSSISDDENATNEQMLQQRLEHVVAEMQRMKTDMEKFQRRAETAETDASNARASLVDMVNKLRKENNSEKSTTAESRKASTLNMEGINGNTHNLLATESELGIIDKIHANGHVRTPELPEHLQRAVATVLRDSNSGNGEALTHSAPYVSMLGVVLIGVGLMAYLNSWQKSER